MALNINGTTGISGVDGSASAPALAGTDSNTGVNFGTDTVNINTGGTTRVSVDSSGNVGIGETTALGKLHVKSADSGASVASYADELVVEGSTDSGITILSATNKDGSLAFGDSGNNVAGRIVYNHSLDHMQFYVNGTQHLDIDQDGRFWVMDSEYVYMSTVNATVASLTLSKDISAANNADYFQCRNSSNTLKMVVEGDGDVKNANNSYGSTSDSKLKENIVDAKSQWDDIKAVKVRNFNLIGDSAKTKMLGVVAQEIETVSSGLVSESIDRDPKTGEDLGTTTKNVKYSILYMKAIKCLQEAQARIETLETEKTKLQTDLTALTARVTALEAA